MNMQIRKIIRELGYKRTKKVFFYKAENNIYVSTDVFVLRLHMDDYQNIDQKDKDTLDKILKEKGEEVDKNLYDAMFADAEDITYTGFLTHVGKRLLAIYDMGEEYAFIDQDISMDFDPASFIKATQNSIIIADLSDNTAFGAVKLISQEVTNRINKEEYFKSETASEE